MTATREPERALWGTRASDGADDVDGVRAHASRRRLVEAGDEARRRLVQDMHDGVQQKMVLAVMQLQRARHKWATDAAAAGKLLDTGLEAAESALAELRELAMGVHPPILSHHGLRAAVEDLVERLPIPVRLELSDGRLPAPVEVNVYFFVSEALTNVVKHSEASQADIRIAVEGSLLTVVAADNGIGGATPTNDGSGLTGLRDRVGAFNGTLSIASEAGQGTTLRAEIPLSDVPAS